MVCWSCQALALILSLNRFLLFYILNIIALLIYGVNAFNNTENLLYLLIQRLDADFSLHIVMVNVRRRRTLRENFYYAFANETYGGGCLQWALYKWFVKIFLQRSFLVFWLKYQCSWTYVNLSAFLSNTLMLSVLLFIVSKIEEGDLSR